MQKEFELTVESKLENLPRISEFIAQTMKQLNIQSVKDIYAVQLSVDEACTNIIQHAYSKNNGCIVIHCTLSSTRKQFIVQIMDWGRPFDLTNIPQPDTDNALVERKEGGLGIFLMHKFMDSVKFTSNQDINTIIMIKLLENEGENNGE